MAQYATAPNMQIRNLGGKVGSYAISTVDFDAWANAPLTQTTTKSRKNKIVKEIIHKIFEECAIVVNDSFWAEKFNAASIGKFPRGFSYHDNVLTFKKGARTFTLDISNNPIEAAYAAMEFFRVNAGIFSPMDEQNSLELQHMRSQTALNQQDLTWGDVNKKMQECLLSNFVVEMQGVMSLTIAEKENLREVIKLGIGDKYFGKHNITVTGGRIQSIAGLLWDNNTRKFYIDPELKPSSSRTYVRNKPGASSTDPTQKDTIPQFFCKWVKFTEMLEKKSIKYNRRTRNLTVNHPGAHGKRLNLVVSTSATTPQTERTVTTDDEDDDDYEE